MGWEQGFGNSGGFGIRNWGIRGGFGMENSLRRVQLEPSATSRAGLGAQNSQHSGNSRALGMWESGNSGIWARGRGMEEWEGKGEGGRRFPGFRCPLPALPACNSLLLLFPFSCFFPWFSSSFFPCFSSLFPVFSHFFPCFSHSSSNPVHYPHFSFLFPHFPLFPSFQP